jgi:hypothetical protein
MLLHKDRNNHPMKQAFKKRKVLTVLTILTGSDVKFLRKKWI